MKTILIVLALLAVSAPAYSAAKPAGWGHTVIVTKPVPRPPTPVSKTAVHKLTKYQQEVRWQKNHPYQCGTICQQSPTWGNLFNFFAGLAK